MNHAETLPKLEPCPFCGSPAEISVPPLGAFGRLMTKAQVVCRARNRETISCRGLAVGETVDDAIAAWNRRSDQKIRDAKAEALIAVELEICNAFLSVHSAYTRRGAYTARKIIRNRIAAIRGGE